MVSTIIFQLPFQVTILIRVNVCGSKHYLQGSEPTVEHQTENDFYIFCIRVIVLNLKTRIVRLCATVGWYRTRSAALYSDASVTWYQNKYLVYAVQVVAYRGKLREVNFFVAFPGNDKPSEASALSQSLSRSEILSCQIHELKKRYNRSITNHLPLLLIRSTVIFVVSFLIWSMILSSPKGFVMRLHDSVTLF